MTDPKATLVKLNQNLNLLQEREAKFAGNAPLELLNQIADHQQAIDLTRQALTGELDEAAWREALCPLLVSLPDEIQRLVAGNIGIVGDYAHIEGGIHFHTSQIDQRGQRVGTQYNIVYQNISPPPLDPATLAAAEARLAGLPLDKIPAPAALPPGSRMPFRPNPLFVGRQADFKALAQTLQGGQAPATPQIAAIGQIAAATGLGGIGKTQLASEFVHRYGQYFAGGVFWLSFADARAIPAEIAACGRAGGLGLRADFHTLPLDDQVRLVLSAWQSPLPRLLVFDNCEDEALLAQWRPPTGGCRVLVTSRRATWDAALGVRALALGVLSRAESIALLRKFRPDLAAAESDLAEIAAELGDLPLALHLAGSYLKTYQADPRFGAPANFLAELCAPKLLEHPALQGEDVTFSPTDHMAHVGRTFALSYDRLEVKDETDALALKLLGRAAIFAPGEPMPRELLLMTLALPADDQAAARRATRGVNRLVALGLLEQEVDGALVLHRLVRAFVAGVTPDKGAEEAVEETLLAEARRLNVAGDPRPLRAWQPHLRTVTDVAQQQEDDRGASLCNAMGDHLSMVADYAGAWPYYEQALAIYEELLGPEHPRAAASLNKLAGLLQAQGDYAGAWPYYERALAIWEQELVIREQVSGPEHRAVEHLAIATSLNNLAGLLKDQADYAGARSYYERALAIYEQVLGPEHHPTTILNNLAALLHAQGDYAGARPYLERALAIREHVFGPEHPDTATSLHNLAALLYAQGDYAGARPYYERALAIREHVFGPEHPDTADSLNGLAGLLQDQGDYARARSYYKRALAIREHVFGPEHPDTAASLNDLAELLRDQGDYARARPYYERALAIHKHVFGPEHPNTAASLHNLAGLLEDQGDYAGARSYYERALAIYEHVFGPEHPDIAASLNGLAGLLYAQGDFAGARSYYKRALAICEHVFGPEHPHTKLVRENLTVLGGSSQRIMPPPPQRRATTSSPINIFSRWFGKKPKQSDPKKVEQAVAAFIRARTAIEEQQLLAKHPELLSAEADLLLEQRLSTARAQSKSTVETLLNERRTRLRNYRQALNKD